MFGRRHHEESEGERDFAREKLVLLDQYGTAFEADAVVAKLLANDIRATAEHMSSYPAIGAAGGLGSVNRVLVFEPDLERARSLLAEE